MKAGKSAPHPENSDKAISLILFVVGQELNSQKARKNLERIRQSAGRSFEVEVVDVLVDYETALSHHILVTPALVRVRPGPPQTVLGTLSDTEKVITALGLEKDPDAA
jgi:circadian clock protein KaiB